MRKNHYSDYAAHALKQFALNRGKEVTFASEAEGENWAAAEKTFAKFKPEEREVLYDLYLSDGSFPVRVEVVCLRHLMPTEAVWALSDRAIRTFSKIRGLI